VLGLNGGPALKMEDVTTCTLPGDYWGSAWSRDTNQQQSYVTIYPKQVVELVNEKFNPYEQKVTTSMLDAMSIQDGRKHAFLRFVNLLTDNSDFSRSVREKMEAEEFSQYLPVRVFVRILQRGVDRGELRADVPLEYLIYNIFSHLITYMMAVATENCFRVDSQMMRPLVYQGIMNEIGKTG